MERSVRVRACVHVRVCSCTYPCASACVAPYLALCRRRLLRVSVANNIDAWGARASAIKQLDGITRRGRRVCSHARMHA